MYACLHTRQQEQAAEILSIADTFSPAVEEVFAGTVVFSIAPLRKLIGSPHQIASEICHLGNERKVEASLAIAANPDTAILLAQHTIGVILVTPGEERASLAPIPLSALPIVPEQLEVLHRWGLQTCEDLAALPEKGVAERLGASGVHVRKLAMGRVDRPLRLRTAETTYEEQVSLDHSVDTLEPLLFLFARVLNDLCARLRSQGQAARVLEVKLALEDKRQHGCELEFPVPLTEPQSILKLLQLHLERHGPEAGVVGFFLRIEPASPRRLQGGLFLPPTPAPDKLQITLARIAAMVGQENVGTPALLNTHRPDAFQLTSLNLSPPSPKPDRQQSIMRLAMRLFRPALQASVVLVESLPRRVQAPGVAGDVLEWAGPWKTSGEWWAATAWTREEWDVALDDGALYRIYSQPQTAEWYVAGVYD